MPGTILTAARCDRIRRLSQVHPQHVVCELTGISASTLYHLRQRDFRPVGRARRPVPTDWGLVAPGRSDQWLQHHYRTGPRTLRRWRREKPVPTIGRGHRHKPRPADLAEVLARLNVAQAQAHYGVCNATLSRWRREVGLATRFEPAAPATEWVDRYVRIHRPAPTGARP